MRSHRALPLAALALLLAAQALAQRPDPGLRLPEQLALRRAWLGHQLPLEAPGRRKPDDAGVYDLLRLRATLPAPREGLPGRVRFDLELEVQAPFGDVLPLLALGFAPILVASEGVELPFERFDEAELLITLPRPARPGERITLSIEANLQPLCDFGPGCIPRGSLRHLSELGWYPLSVEFPLTDRFEVELAFEVFDPVGVAGTGARLPPEPMGGGGQLVRFATEARTILPAFALGDFQTIGTRGPVEVQAPLGFPAQSAQALLVEGEAMLGFYSQLYVPYPFSRLGMTPISEEAGVAIGPQANILLPSIFYLIPPDDPNWPLVRQTVAHEIGHQYFFNLVGVLDAEEAWLSEAFAEYSATRFEAEVTGDEDHRKRNALGYLYGVPPAQDAPIYGEAVRANPFYFEIVYLKGSALLHQLKTRVGVERFDEALRGYVEAFSGEIATTPELQASLEASLGQPLGDFFEQWIYRAGHPTLEIRAEPARQDRAVVRLTVRQESRFGRFSGSLPVQLERPGQAAIDVAIELEGGEFQFAAQDTQRVRVDPALTVLRRVRPDPVQDVDLTGVVDGRDYLDVRFALGLEAPDPRFDDALDVNGDGRITAADLEAVRGAVGAGW